MQKNKMERKLKELYKAQERYFKLLYDITTEIRSINKPIHLGPVVGDLDGYGMDSVEESMTALEKEMKRFGIEWEDKLEKQERETL